MKPLVIPGVFVLTLPLAIRVPATILVSGVSAALAVAVTVTVAVMATVAAIPFAAAVPICHRCFAVWSWASLPSSHTHHHEADA